MSHSAFPYWKPLPLGVPLSSRTYPHFGSFGTELPCSLIRPTIAHCTGPSLASVPTIGNAHDSSALQGSGRRDILLSGPRMPTARYIKACWLPTRAQSLPRRSRCTHEMRLLLSCVHVLLEQWQRAFPTWRCTRAA